MPSSIRASKHSLADLRSLQDWYLRYQLETVPGVAEVATIGGFVRQYQVSSIPTNCSPTAFRFRRSSTESSASTNEVGGSVLELSGAEYMIRGLGYLRIAG